LATQKNEAWLKQKFLSGLAGDRAAYHEFLAALTWLLRQYVRRQLARVGQVDCDAEDIVQEAILAIHQRRHTYVENRLVTAWVYAIARYKMIDFLRATNSDKKLVELNEAEICADGDAEKHDSVIELDQFLSELPEHFRQPIILTKLYGMSVAEAATHTRRSQAAVKVSIRRGMRALNKLAEREK
jgi:RNA polymerase sigma-70 factor, ECF subfamily